jgi:hypothetical protein
MTIPKDTAEKHTEETPAPKPVPADGPPPLTLEVIQSDFADRVSVGRMPEVFGDDYDGLIIPWQAQPNYAADRIKAMNIDEVVNKLWEEYFVPGYGEVVRKCTNNPSGPSLFQTLILDQELGKLKWGKECFIGTASHARELLEKPDWQKTVAFFCAMCPNLPYLCTCHNAPDFPCDEAVLDRLRREDSPMTTKDGRNEARPKGTIVGMTWQDARDKAEEFVDKHGFPGPKDLKLQIGCHARTLAKAIHASEKLKAAQEVYNQEKTPKPKAVALSDAILARAESKSVEPADEAAVNEILQSVSRTDMIAKIKEWTPVISEATGGECADMKKLTAALDTCDDWKLATVYLGVKQQADEIKADDPKRPRRRRKL